MLALSLLGCAAITLGWLWFFVRRDAHPEPLWLLGRTFAWGMFAWGVAAAFEASLGQILNDSKPLVLLLVALLTAVTEEACKFAAAHTAVTEKEFDEPMDGLVYAVTAALGFALIENLTYVLGFGLTAAAWHTLLTTLAHALFSAPQGYALGSKQRQLGRWWAAKGLLTSVGLHFIFNGLLTGVAGWPQLVALALSVAVMTFLATRYYQNFENSSRARAEPPNTP